MTNSLQWFRLYHRMIDDEKIRLLAFEDRWHFIALCCLKADGLLDEPESEIKWRKIAVKMGVQTRELDEIRRRLSEVGLVDENLHPTAWDDLQYKSDNSTERVRKYREKSKTKQVKRPRNVSVAPQETESETDTEGANAPISPEPDKSAPAAKVVFELPCTAGETFSVFDSDIAEWSAAFPAVDILQQLAAMRSWLNANPQKRKTKRGARRFAVSWLDRRQNSGSPSARGQSPPGRRMNAVEANLARRERRNESANGRRDSGNVQRLSSDQPGLRNPVGNLAQALRWEGHEGSGDH